MTHSEHVVLVGSMGVGKTSIGHILAARLGRPLRDSDLDLRAENENARDIAQRQGVDVLHRWEADHLLHALSDPTPAVIAAAASVVEDERCRAALGPPFVVWLWTPPETLLARSTTGDHRRDLGDDPRQALVTLAHHRDPLYRQLADAKVDTSRGPPEQLADKIAAQLSH